MNEPVGHFSLSIVHPMLFPGIPEDSIPETLSLIAKDDFFSAVELSHVESTEVRKRIVDILKTARLGAILGAHPTVLAQKLDLNSTDDGERKKAVSKMKELIDEAAEIGANRLILMSGPDPGIERRMTCRNLLVNSLIELCSYGHQVDVSISLEPFDRSVEKKCVIGPASDALSVSEEVRRRFPDFGLTYDMAHGILLDENPADIIRKLREHLVHVHLANCVKVASNPLYGDKHPRFGVDFGEIDAPQVADFLRALSDISYASAERALVGFELKPQPAESPDLIISNAKRTFTRATKML